MSMLGARDHEAHSYMEIADTLRQHGAQPEADRQELWPQNCFSMCWFSNTDDHLRIHGFLYERGNGWRLAPTHTI